MNKEEKRKKLFTYARGYVGTPYIFGAQSSGEKPETFDCSSFIQHIFKCIDIELPRSSILQAGDKQGEEVVYSGIESLEPGDVVFMRSDRGYYNDEMFGGREISVGHVGLYLGDDEIIHAKSSLGGVVIQKLSDLTKDPHYAITFAKRFF